MTESQESPAIKAESSNGQGHGPGTVVMEGEPSHHTRRPMNAFLIFCKRHRSVVRDKFPNHENRSITKILGEWWANLDSEDKACYTGLARQYKDAFFDANPDFKWYKLPAPPLRNFSTRPASVGSGNADLDTFPNNEAIDTKAEQTNNNHLTKLNYNNAQPSTSKQFHDESRPMFTPGKLADEAQMGGLSSLIVLNKAETNDNGEMLSQTLPKHENDTTPPGTPPSDSNFNSHIIPGPPKKRPFSTIDNEIDRSKIYRNDDTTPPSKERTVAQDFKMKKLQDELSETTRHFKLTFDKSNEIKSYNNGNQIAASIPATSPSTDNETDSKPADNNLTKQTLIEDVVSKEFISSQRGNTSSDESQDKDGQMVDEMQVYDHKGSWMGEDDPSLSRSSRRACKGKRYQEFMAYGGLIVNKRQKKEHSDQKHVLKQEINDKISYTVNSPSCNWKIYENLAKETGSKPLKENLFHKENESDLRYCENMDVPESAYKYQQEDDDLGQDGYYFNDNHSDRAAECRIKRLKALDFDLDQKIKALPSLSLEKFQQKKKENKKRKKSLATAKHKDARPRLPANVQPYSVDSVSNSLLPYQAARPDKPHTLAAPMLEQQPQAKSELHQILTNEERIILAEQKKSAIIGSKKRKPRKISITRLDVNDCMTLKHKESVITDQMEVPTSQAPLPAPQSSDDMCALTTLAEIASISSKMPR